jgi:NADH-quinone oxidoreductase subunit E
MQESCPLTEGEIDRIVERHRGELGSLLGALEELQEAMPGQWLPEAALERVAKDAGVPASRVYSVATFYPHFNLAPQGAHSVVVCRGTACHTRGSLALLKRAAGSLGMDALLSADDAQVTDPEQRFTIRTVACFGQCALAPVVMIDGVTYSRVTYERLAALLEGLRLKGGARRAAQPRDDEGEAE